ANISDSSPFHNTSRPRSLGKKIMLDFEHSVVHLSSTKRELRNVLMQSRHSRDDCYASLFQQSRTIETDGVMTLLKLHPQIALNTTLLLLKTKFVKKMQVFKKAVVPDRGIW
nr:hypothetical protein [Tanacetum cinerariifolium]